MAAQPEGPAISISADVDGEHVVHLAAAFVHANDEWHDKSGKPRLARELMEALLCNVCDVLQGAPDTRIRAAMAAQAIAFIVRHSGADPADVRMAHLATMQGVAAFGPAGTA